MGCSNPHPHCQIWASDFMPNEMQKKDINQLAYFEKYGSPMLFDYVRKELELDERVVLKNQHFVVLTPYWAIWPFEVMILPCSRNITRIDELTDEEVTAFARIMLRLLKKFDNLFSCSFPYTMGLHGAPTKELLEHNNDHWTFQ